MKIIKFGPGHGHNIEQFIRCFDRDIAHELTFVHTGRCGFNGKYANVKFVPFFSADFIGCLFRIAIGYYSIVWLHGGNRLLIPMSLLKGLSLLFQKRTVWVLNVWGEKILEKMESGGLWGRLYIMSANAFDCIQFNWYTLEYRSHSYLNDKKTITLLWGLPSEFYDDCDERSKEMIDRTVEFNGFRFFFPKSITSHSEHILLAASVKFLVETYPELEYKIYILEGNGREDDVWNSFKESLDEFGVADKFCFISFDRYLDPSEMAYLWKKMSCGLQIVKKDQLSNTFVEPQALGLPVIASNLVQYRDFESIFNVKATLSHNTASSIALEMSKVINDEAAGRKESRHNYSDIIKERYNFDANFVKMLDYYEALAEKE